MKAVLNLVSDLQRSDDFLSGFPHFLHGSDASRSTAFVRILIGSFQKNVGDKLPIWWQTDFHFSLEGQKLADDSFLITKPDRLSISD